MMKVKKLTAILAMTVCLFLTAGTAEAYEWPFYYPRAMKLIRTDTGDEVPNGGTVAIEANQTLIFDVYAADINDDGIVDYDDFGMFLLSGDNMQVKVGLDDETSGADSGLAAHFSSANPVLPPDKLGTITVTATGVVDTTVSWQLLYTDQNTGEIYPTGTFRVHFTSSYTVYTGYLFAPKSISLRQADGKKINTIEMTAGTTRTYEMWIDDVNNDGVIDEFDYDVFAITGYKMVPTVVSESDGDLRGRATTPSLLGDTPEMKRYPTRISTVTISAINPGGDSGSDYNPVYTSFYAQLDLGGTTAGGLSVGALLGDAGTLTTQTISVRINALDDGDDGGGTCSTAGLGAFLPLTLFLFFRNRRG